MDYLKSMFHVPLLHLAVRDWDNKKRLLTQMRKEVEEKITYHEEDSVKTNFHIDNASLIEQVSEVFKEEISICKQSFDAHHVCVRQAWFELAEKGDWHEPHTHGATGYSSVCFIDYNPEVHTATKFISPFPNLADGSMMGHQPRVQEGSIIFFPSSILHYTDPNLSGEPRFIISFNLG